MKKLLCMITLLTLGFFIALLGVSPLAHATTPTISGVSGTIATGQVLTITGSYMMDEDKTKWDSFLTTHSNAYGFEGTSPGTSGQCNDDCYCELGPRDGVYDTNVKLSGNKSIRWSLSGGSSNCPIGNLSSYNAVQADGGDSGDKYYRWYARWDVTNGWPNNHIKMFGPGGSLIHADMLAPVAVPDGLLPTEMIYIYDGGTSHYANIPLGQLENGRWYCMEVHINTNPKRIDIWMDGFPLWTNVVPSEGYDVDFFLFGLINICGTNSNFTMNHHFDNMAWGTSRIYPASTVEIGNSPNYATATKIYQQPLYLSDGSVQIKVTLAGLGSGPYYLFVTNNRQERSAAYSLSGGGGGDTTPPSVSITAPSNGQTVSGTVTISANASDNVAVGGVQFKIDDSNLGAEDTTKAYAISCDTTTLPNGVHAITAVARDTSGNLTTSNPISVTVNNVTGETTPPSVLTGDTTPPSVSITAPVYGQTVSGTVTISANASDNVAVGGVQFKIDGSNLGAEDTTNAYAISCDTTTLSNGVHAITAVVRDTSGNLTTSNPISVTVNNTIVIPPATVLFEEDFEDTNYVSRGWYDTTATSSSLTSSQYYSGSHAYECHFTAAATHCSGGDPKRMLFAATDSVYLSYWIKLSSNWVGSGLAYHPHIFYFLTNLNGAYDGFYGTYTTAYIEISGLRPRIGLHDSSNINLNNIGVNLCNSTENRASNGCNGICDNNTWDVQDCYDGGGGVYLNGRWTTPTGAMTYNAWHHIEAYMKMNSVSSGKGQRDGIMQMWVDGQLLVNYIDIIYRTNQHPSMQFNQLALSPYIGDGSPIDQYFWLDDLSLATSRPGTDIAPAPPVVINIQ